MKTQSKLKVDLKKKPLCIPNIIKIQHFIRNQRCQPQIAIIQITTCIVGIFCMQQLKVQLAFIVKNFCNKKSWQIAYRVW
jgi:hypothetical protein